MFYVSQKPHIKRNLNGIKTDGEYCWNIWRIWEEESTRDAAVATIIITAIFTNTAVIFTNISITFPHLYPAVHSPAYRCTLYLNMVLYASYYYPMMCCHPMMSE